MSKPSFAVPVGTPETLNGGDLLSKHFPVGPHSKDTFISAIAEDTKVSEIAAAIIRRMAPLSNQLRTVMLQPNLV